MSTLNGALVTNGLSSAAVRSPSAVNEKLGSGCSGVFQRQTEIAEAQRHLK